MSIDKTSSGIRYEQPVALDVWKSWNVHRWASVAGLYLSAAAMIVLAIANYRTLDATLHRDREFKRQDREFNEELVAAIEELADKTGILTSADHCPVRFRLRFPDGGMLANTMTARLTRLLSDAEDPVDEQSSTASGLIDFGLHAPGTYRLEVWSPDMWLVHEFDVLPGAPVDRVVICPSQASPADVQVDVNWPAELVSEDVVALIEVLPGPFETGDWRWEPKRDVPPQYVVATTGSDAQRPFEGLNTPHYDSVLQAAGLPVAEFSGDVQVTYRYCRIGSITFLQLVRDSHSGEQLQLLGTVHYESVGLAASSVVPGWEAAAPPPRFEADPGYSSHWNVDIPPRCVDELLQRIRETANGR